MDKYKRGSAYIMVVFVSFPILLAALTALAVSINSRNISARHSDFFGMYELASAAIVFSIHSFEEAYLANRHAAHRKTLLYFAPVPENDSGEFDENCEELNENYGGIYNNDEESVDLPVDYINRFRYYLYPEIREYLEKYFSVSGNVFTRSFTINLDTDHVFNGTIRISPDPDCERSIIFMSQVTKVSNNIITMRETVRGIIRWPAPVQRKVYLCEINVIKNLDFFTPWVVELKKYTPRS